MKNNRKGFTIVELVIVIAVIAILASVLVPTFSGIILKAKRSADTQVVRMLNEDIAIDLAQKDKSKHDTMYDAVQACITMGVSPDKISAKSDYNIAWESSSGKFVLIDLSTSTVIYPQNDNNYDVYSIIGREVDYFVVTTYDNRVEEDQNFKFSVYAFGKDWPSEITIHAGFDTGDVKGFEKITYENDTESKNIIIRTSEFTTKLVIDSSMADAINHNGYSGNVYVKAINNGVYNEYGIVGKMIADKGYVTLAKESVTYQIEAKNTAFISIIDNAIVYNSNAEEVLLTQENDSSTFVNNEVSGCIHENTEYFNDVNYTYEVCKHCGYTLVVSNDVKKTVFDSTNASVNYIVPKTFYLLGSANLEETNIISISKEEYNKSQNIGDARYLQFVAAENGTYFSVSFVSGSWKYSLDAGETWKNGVDNKAINIGDVGDYVLLKGKNCVTDEDNCFRMGNHIAAFGSVTSLTDGIGNDENVKLTDNCYRYMFFCCVYLISAPELPAMTLSSFCYEFMFYYCRSLVKAPALPAMNLAPYCYKDIFYMCYGFTEAPELPATTLADGCYSCMFADCINLKKTPELPAVNLVYDCYSAMFYECNALEEATVLPAMVMTPYCYYEMFYGCRSLVEAPELPSTTLAYGCYHSMFEGCRSLKIAPELPALTLAKNCYSYMFSCCANLENIPKLPATKLEDQCYDHMFYGINNKIKIDTTGSEENLIFTLPSTTGLYIPILKMFLNVDLKAGSTYYWSIDE